MKYLYLFFLMFWLVLDVFGQQQVEYIYDSAGNRTQRNVITITTRSTLTESEQFDFSEIQKYEDFLGDRKVVIYPNPTRGILQIEFQGYGFMYDARLLLYNMQGRLLLQENNVEQSSTLDLTPYPSGIYILHLIEGVSRKEWKIIKE